MRLESTERELNLSWRVVGIAGSRHGLSRGILHERERERVCVVGERKWRFAHFLARRQWWKRGFFNFSRFFRMPDHILRLLFRIFSGYLHFNYSHQFKFNYIVFL